MKSVIQDTKECYLCGADEWKDIAGYEGAYKISSCGKVRSADRHITQRNRYGSVMKRLFIGIDMKATDNGSGYLFISLKKDGKRKNHYIHRLVAQHFIGPIPKGYVVNHKDFDKRNNNINNLEIITQKENTIHSRHRMAGILHKSPGLKEPYIRERRGGYEVTFRKKYIGKYKTLDEAICNRDKAMGGWMAKKQSILQDKKCCYFTGKTGSLHKHHCYPGPNRKVSDNNGFWVWLTPELHNGNDPNAVHTKPNEGYDMVLKQRCQQEFEKTHTREQFLNLIGRNYLDGV